MVGCGLGELRSLLGSARRGNGATSTQQLQQGAAVPQIMISFRIVSEILEFLFAGPSTAFVRSRTASKAQASSCLSLQEPQRQVNTSAFIKSTNPFFPLKHKEHIHISLPFLSSPKAQGRN